MKGVINSKTNYKDKIGKTFTLQCDTFNQRQFLKIKVLIKTSKYDNFLNILCVWVNSRSFGIKNDFKLK